MNNSTIDFQIFGVTGYTVMSNYHLRDKSLSFKAKGLLSFMLSLPEDWDYSLAGLCAISKESKDGVRTILKELQEYHYLVIEKSRNDKGLFEYNYLIYELPHKLEIEKKHNHPDMDFPYLDTPYLDKPDMETPTQINTNKQNTKKQIDKIDKEEISSFFDAEKHNQLTRELINSKYIDANDSQITSYDKLFDYLLINNSYQDLIKIVKYIVPRVISRGFKDENGKYITNKFGYLKNAINSNIDKLNSYSRDELWDYDSCNDDNDNLYNLIDNDDFER